MSKQLFKQHIQIQCDRISRALTATSFDGVVIGSGTPFTYFADDQDASFHPTPHFAHWCPERSPFHLLQLRPGLKPRLVFYAPNDFWHEAPSIAQSEWAEEFDIIQVHDPKVRWQSLGPLRNYAFVGQEHKEAEEYGLSANPPLLLSYLDWFRAEKTEYEIFCLERANEIGARGHEAARKAFMNGASELDTHIAFLSAVQMREEDLPYPSIIGMDEKSAILHYRPKRTQHPDARVMLIDSGAMFQNYGSDITRTYVKESAHKTFGALLGSMEIMQQQLCDQVKAGLSFEALHKNCHLGIGQMLIDNGVLKDCTAETSFTLGLTKLFYPHGLGHMLGIQVHDVGAHQSNEKGEQLPPSEEFPTLRMRRPLRVNEVVTVEPGLYFIPMRLDTARSGDLSKHCDWKLIDEMIPLGGIRIEDNVVVGAQKSRNLTRQYLGNDFRVSGE